MTSAIEAILRQPGRVLFQLRQPAAGPLIAAMAIAALGCSLAYGFVVGTFSGGMQLWAAPVKIASGLALSALICLPSLYIFACLSGSPARLGEVTGWIAGLSMLMSILLIGFAPVAWVFSQSTDSVAAMGTLHVVFWVIAIYFGLRFMNAGFRAHERGSGGLPLWMAIFVLVMFQMTTTVRPLVGTSDTFLPTEKRSFIAHWIQCLSESNLSAPSGVSNEASSRAPEEPFQTERAPSSTDPLAGGSGNPQVRSRESI